jgi:F-type H+-transporting ATPase subunit delta
VTVTRSASRQALAELRERQRAVIDDPSVAGSLLELADELFGVGGLLGREPRLRRNLADPATEPEGRVALANQLLSGKVSDGALKIVKAAVALRWSTPWDLADSVEGAGDEALFAAAERAGALDTVEDELFRVERILDTSGDLAGLLDEQSAPAERRVALLDGLTSGKVSPITQKLLGHAVSSQRKRSVVLAIDDLLEQAARRQERSVARVVAAAALTDAQQRRLVAALSALYGRPVTIRAAIDPAVRGGLVVRVGDEVIDGSVAARLAGARIALTG